MTTAAPDQLRAAGLKVTPGRVALLSALDEFPHSKAETLCLAIQTARPEMSVQSVHNVLADLTAAGLIRRIEPAGFSALYECRVNDNHHHVVCSGCGAIEDVDCVRGAAACLSPSDTSGFTIDEAEVTFWGFCPACE
jgi:Fur family ferric uptake transcriptional regulator